MSKPRVAPKPAKQEVRRPKRRPPEIDDALKTVRECETQLAGIAYGLRVLNPRPPIPFTAFVLQPSERRQFAWRTLVDGIGSVTISLGALVERIEGINKVLRRPARRV